LGRALRRFKRTNLEIKRIQRHLIINCLIIKHFMIWTQIWNLFLIRKKFEKKVWKSLKKKVWKIVWKNFWKSLKKSLKKILKKCEKKFEKK
jgi:hypothetical protein